MQTINTPACSPAALLVVSDCDLLQRLRLEAGAGQARLLLWDICTNL